MRDKLLNWFFGVRVEHVLNSGKSRGGNVRQISKEIAESVLALKNAVIISDSGVDYAKLLHSKAYIHFRAHVSPRLRELNLDDLGTIEDKLAFWINLYNLLTIDAVLQFKIKESVTEGRLGINRFFRQAAYLVGGFRFSLDDIEHGILRANQGLPFFPGRHFANDDPRRAFTLKDLDARIHFALNCASKSCPPIAYYVSAKIDEQLDLAAANFIAGETRFDESHETLILSRIFKWYASDFGGRIDVLETIKKYLPNDEPLRKMIETQGISLKITYARYDWRLNASG
jgi:hypothetical protein